MKTEEKKLGWINPKIELPPIGLEVLILYPNPAYNDHEFITIAERISETQFATKRSEKKYWLKLDIEQDKEKRFKSYVKRWAYDLEQKLENECQCPSCFNHSK
jgi:hypothetical protein